MIITHQKGPVNSIKKQKHIQIVLEIFDNNRFKNRFSNMGMSFTWFDGGFIILENWMKLS